MNLIQTILKFFGYTKDQKIDYDPNTKYYDDQLKIIQKSYQNQIDSLNNSHLEDWNRQRDQHKAEITDNKKFRESTITNHLNELNDLKFRLEREFELSINKVVKLKFNDWKTKEEKIIREDAISRSKSVTTGQITEHFAPYHPDFKYNPKDARFFGSPIDLIIYDGLYDNGNVENIIFMEIKTGKSQMSSKQRSIKRCIESGNIVFEEFRIGD